MGSRERQAFVYGRVKIMNMLLKTLFLVYVCLFCVHGGIVSIKSIGYDYDYPIKGGGGGGGKTPPDPTPADTQPYEPDYPDYPATDITTVAPKVTTKAPKVTEPPTVTVSGTDVTTTATAVTSTGTGVTFTTTPISFYARPLNFYVFNCIKNEPLWDIPNPPTILEMTRKLYADRLTGYDTRIRPLQNQSQPIYMNTKFVPLTLIEFDTFQQRFSLLAYIRIRWYDELMMWRPKYYMCMASLKVSTTGLWTPNIVIHKVNKGYNKHC